MKSWKFVWLIVWTVKQQMTALKVHIAMITSAILYFHLEKSVVIKNNVVLEHFVMLFVDLISHYQMESNSTAQV